MSRHTPGPWRVARRADTFQVATVELLGIYSEHPIDGGRESGMPEDDARLIAAAPDLLAALERIADMYPSDMESSRVARAAIAKAKGEA